MDCERSSLKLCARFLVVADNLEVLQAHFLQKVLELPSLTPSAKYCTQPNASSVKYILLRRKYRAKFNRSFQYLNTQQLGTLIMKHMHAPENVEENYMRNLALFVSYHNSFTCNYVITCLNIVKYIYSFSSIFTTVERIPRDKRGGVAA